MVVDDVVEHRSIGTIIHGIKQEFQGDRLGHRRLWDNLSWNQVAVIKLNIIRDGA